MEYTVHHPDGSTTTHEQDCPYIREEEHETLVLTNDRQRLFPKVARRFIPGGHFITGVTMNSMLVYDNPEPPELEGTEQARFVVRDETGARCTVHTRREPSGVYAVVTDSDVEAGRLSDGRVVQHRFPDMDTAEEWLSARERPAAELVPAADLSAEDIRRAEDALQ
jgi:hypothetical protein